jgi:FkbM family methyltransferase
MFGLKPSPESTDAMPSNKWSLAARHLCRMVMGLPRFLIAHPLWGLKLFIARVRYFFTRQFTQPIVTPDGFAIETSQELISYWSFFIERECLASEWAHAVLSETKPLVVDVGANAGLFSHRVWTLKHDARFILFEPSPFMAKKISKWGAATGASHTIHNKAASDYCGTTTFFASSENDPSATLEPRPDKHLKYEVAVVTLDSILPDEPILVLKIDVEGAECNVLAGAKRTIERTRFMIIEAHTRDDVDRIKQKMGEQWFDKQVGASDHLFMRRSQQTVQPKQM